MEVTILVPILGLFGLTIGSFLAAFAYRWPRGISFVAGRSFCPKCKSKINWHDNVPLLSFILLKGKCRNCKESISIRYPLIEGVTAIVFVVTGLVWSAATGPSGSALVSWKIVLGNFFLPVSLFVASSLIAVLVIDFEHQLIPDGLVYVLIITSILLLVFFQSGLVFSHLAAGFGACLFLLFLVGVTRGKGMGLGDVKLALPLGTLQGWPGTLVWLFLSFLIGGVFAILLLVSGKASFGKKIAFGPFLILGFVLTLFWGERIVQALGF